MSPLEAFFQWVQKWLADYLNNNIVNNEIYAMLDNMNNQAEQTNQSNQSNQSNQNDRESDDSETETEESDEEEPDELEVPEVPDNSDINNRLNDKVSFTINKTFPLSNTPHYLEKRTSRKFCEFIGLPRLSSQSEDDSNKTNKGWAGQKQGKLKGNQRSGAADAIRNRNSEKKSEKEDEIISAILADVENLKKSIPQGVCKSNESIQLTITRLMGHINAITINHSTVQMKRNLTSILVSIKLLMLFLRLKLETILIIVFQFLDKINQLLTLHRFLINSVQPYILILLFLFSELLMNSQSYSNSHLMMISYQLLKLNFLILKPKCLVF